MERSEVNGMANEFEDWLTRLKLKIGHPNCFVAMYLRDLEEGGRTTLNLLREYSER